MNTHCEDDLKTRHEAALASLVEGCAKHDLAKTPIPIDLLPLPLNTSTIAEYLNPRGFKIPTV